MSAKKIAREATEKLKTESRQTIAKKIDLALGKYKIELDENKYKKRLKKASKLLSKVVMLPMSKRSNGKTAKSKVIISAQ